VFDEELEEVAEDVDAEEGEVFGLVEVEVGVGHVGVGDGEEFGEDETGLVEGAHPGIEVVGGKGDLEMILVLGIGSEGGEVAGDGLASGGEEVVEFGGDEALPIAVGFGVGGGGVREESVADAGGVALVEDAGEVLEAVEEDGVEAAEAEALGAVGLDAEVFHSDFSMWARSW